MPEEAPESAQNEQGSQSSADDDNWELFKADDFRMYCMKVLPCSKRFCHDWTVCPYAHPGEKAKRRDPRVHSYTGIACPNMKKDQACVRGDNCPYAHNVFEYWLHPTRYRTQLCNDMEKCNRKICFFAHSPEEVRHPTTKPFVPPEALAAATTNATLEAVRKAAEDSQKEAASASLVDALLKAHAGDNSLLMAQLQGAQAAAAGSAGSSQDSAHLVDALTSLLHSCGLVQSPEGRTQSRRRSFSDGIRVVQRPANPLKDDRLDLSASGKCRSDPARLRAQGRQRGRGRHSLDIGRDLKRTMTNPTIDENKPCLPTIESLVNALAGSNSDFLPVQGSFRQEMPNCSTPFSSPEEMAAYSAGVAAAQQMMINPEDLQQLLQASAAAQQPNLDWNANAELLHQIQQTREDQASAAWPAVYGQRRRQQPPQNVPMSLHAAASMRAHAALTGEPWLGDGPGAGRAAQCPALPESALLALQNPFAAEAPGAHGAQPLPSEYAMLPGQQAQQGPSEFEAYLQTLKQDNVWGNNTAMGLAHLGPKAEGADFMGQAPEHMLYDGRPSMDSRRSSDSNYMTGMAHQEFMPHCEPIDEYTSMRTSTDASMRMSMDSMRSGVSPNQTHLGHMGQALPTADYRSSSLFTHFGGFGQSRAPPPQGESGPYGSGPDNHAQEQH